ncbi:MAG: potassium transporter Trk [Microbacterium sp.]
MTTGHRLQTAHVRRSPRYAAFLLVGAGVGVLTAMILTFAFDGTADPSTNTGVSYSSGQVFGFLCLVCIPIGLALSGGLALLFDRILSRRIRDVRIDRETVTSHTDPS